MTRGITRYRLLISAFGKVAVRAQTSISLQPSSFDDIRRSFQGETSFGRGGGKINNFKNFRNSTLAVDYSWFIPKDIRSLEEKSDRIGRH